MGKINCKDNRPQEINDLSHVSEDDVIYNMSQCTNTEQYMETSNIISNYSKTENPNNTNIDLNGNSVEFTMTNQENIVIPTPTGKSMESSGDTDGNIIKNEIKNVPYPTPSLPPNNSSNNNTSQNNGSFSNPQKPGTMHRNKFLKKAKARKMPLEVIDEINGEIINRNQKDYNIMKNQNQLYKYCNMRGMKFNLNESYDKQSFKDIINKKKTWRDININYILPKEILLSTNENDFIFQGDFLIFTKTNDIRKSLPNLKCLIMTRSELRIYRSKEAMLYMKNPLQRISLFNISQCDIITLPQIKNLYTNIKNLMKYNFYVQQITINGMKIESDEKNSENNVMRENFCTIKGDNFLEGRQGGGSESKCKMRKGKKMKLITETEEIKTNSSNSDKYYNNNEDMIIFSSNDEDLVNRWIRIVNFFLCR